MYSRYWSWWIDFSVNGTIGHIIGHDLKTSTFQVTSVDGVTVNRHPHLPTRLLVRIKDCHLVLSEGLPPGVIPVEPLHTKIEIEIPGPRTKKRKSSGPSMPIDQFPMVAAFACTPEKLQGQTCKDGIILARLTRAARPISPQTLYVAFSRTVSLSKLTLTHPISRQDASNFKPGQDTAGEMNRLHNMIVVPTYFDAPTVHTFQKWLRSEHLQ